MIKTAYKFVNHARLFFKDLEYDFSTLDLTEEEMAYYKSQKIEPRVKKILFGDMKDVFCSALVTNLHFNTNIQSYLKEKEGHFGWGYLGERPLNFAMNILYHFTDGKEEFAREHAEAFTRHFLMNLNTYHDEMISARKILRWIEDKKYEIYKNENFFGVLYVK